MSEDPTGATDPTWCYRGNPRWPYDKFVKTYFLKPMGYCFFREAHDRSMADLRGHISRRERSRDRLLPVLDKLESAGVTGLFNLVDTAITRDEAEQLKSGIGVEPEDLIALFGFVKGWLIPNPAQLRQLFDETDETLGQHFARLKQHKVANSYTMLEAARTAGDRKTLVEKTGVPEDIILDFVHRADVSRLPYVSGSVVRMLWTIGIRSLRELRDSDPDALFERTVAYYGTHGKGKPFDSTKRNTQGMIDWANWLPVVVQE